VLPEGKSAELDPNSNYYYYYYDPGVDSASDRNEYQEYFLGVKAAGA
jgi:hypothetical protein